MTRFFPILIAISFLTVSCNNEDSEKVNNNSSEKMPEEYKNNPTSVEWETQMHDFGTIIQDTVVQFVYKFKNTGDKPLMVVDCQATCGCTVPDCKQPPVPPGANGEILVKFNSANKANRVNKTVKVYMNTGKDFEEVKFTVFVDDGFQKEMEKDSTN
jgi:hypothetical protein